MTEHSPDSGVASQAPSQRVVRTAKQDRLNGGWHRHVSALCLADGRLVPRDEAIADIRAGRATYHVLVGGSWAAVGVVERCRRCGETHLGTNRDSILHTPLIHLPDC